MWVLHHLVLLFYIVVMLFCVVVMSFVVSFVIGFERYKHPLCSVGDVRRASFLFADSSTVVSSVKVSLFVIITQRSIGTN